MRSRRWLARRSRRWQLVVLVASAATALAAVVALSLVDPSISGRAPSASERYGLIIGSDLRGETTPQSVGTLTTASFRGAVSPEGRRIAYWEIPNGASGARVLRVMDLRVPAGDRVVVTLAESEAASIEHGSGVVWSSDGSGLLFAVHAHYMTAPPSPGTPPLAQTLDTALRRVDLGSGTVREIDSANGRFPLQPIAWDPGRGVAAAVEIGPGGYAVNYVAIRGTTKTVTTRTPLDQIEIPAPLIRASPDASRVFAVGRFPSPALNVWPLAEPERRTLLPLGHGDRVSGAMWRNADEIVVELESADTESAARIELWSPFGTPRVLVRGLRGLDAVRPDGTGAIVGGHTVDLVTGATVPIPFLPKAHASFILR